LDALLSKASFSFEREESSLYYNGYADMSIEPVEIYGMDISKQDIVAYLAMAQVSIKFPYRCP
jgi:hypothetical protein